MGDMKCRWLEPRTASNVFFYSIVDLAALLAFSSVGALPGATDFLNRSPIKMVLVVLFASLVIVGIPSLLLLFFGMAIHCVLGDGSSHFAKYGWFVLFLFTGPIGSTIYFFLVYRNCVRREALAA